MRAPGCLQTSLPGRAIERVPGGVSRPAGSRVLTIFSTEKSSAPTAGRPAASGFSAAELHKIRSQRYSRPPPRFPPSLPPSRRSHPTTTALLLPTHFTPSPPALPPQPSRHNCYPAQSDPTPQHLRPIQPFNPSAPPPSSLPPLQPPPRVPPPPPLARLPDHASIPTPSSTAPPPSSSSPLAAAAALLRPQPAPPPPSGAKGRPALPPSSQPGSALYTASQLFQESLHETSGICLIRFEMFGS